MLLETLLKASKKSGWTVTAAAAGLGVTRTHLSLVLHGHRVSRRLMARYQALVSVPRSKRSNHNGNGK